eukprot:SAG11_NODE_4101_length_2065_cov_1.721261_1_plen_181_part_10
MNTGVTGQHPTFVIWSANFDATCFLALCGCRHLILGSQSASRRAILSASGAEFDTLVPDIDEKAIGDRLSDAPHDIGALLIVTSRHQDETDESDLMIISAAASVPCAHALCCCARALDCASLPLCVVLILLARSAVRAIAIAKSDALVQVRSVLATAWQPPVAILGCSSAWSTIASSIAPV